MRIETDDLYGELALFFIILFVVGVVGGVLTFLLFVVLNSLLMKRNRILIVGARGDEELAD